jgi:hypothetical protein
MSFATPQHKTNGHIDLGGSHLTERDLMRQVASNFTKEELTALGKLNQAGTLDAKVVMKENLSKCHKVW